MSQLKIKTWKHILELEKPVPQPRFGDRMTSDCKHVTERTTSKTQWPGVIRYSFAHLFANEPHQEQTENQAHRPEAREAPGLYFSC